jgi:hypothetical protein
MGEKRVVLVVAEDRACADVLSTSREHRVISYGDQWSRREVWGLNSSEPAVAPISGGIRTRLLP